jgi:hypothetical protein
MRKGKKNTVPNDSVCRNLRLPTFLLFPFFSYSFSSLLYFLPLLFFLSLSLLPPSFTQFTKGVKNFYLWV